MPPSPRPVGSFLGICLCRQLREIQRPEDISKLAKGVRVGICCVLCAHGAYHSLHYQYDGSFLKEGYAQNGWQLTISVPIHP